MNLISKLAVGAVALVALSGCYYYGDRYPYDRYGDRYGYDNGYGPGYDGWYDDYYGPYYGGYWGPEGDFYYYDSDRHPHRDADHHFRHERFEGSHEVRGDHGDRGDRGYEHDRDYDHDR